MGRDRREVVGDGALGGVDRLDPRPERGASSDQATALAAGGVRGRRRRFDDDAVAEPAGIVKALTATGSGRARSAPRSRAARRARHVVADGAAMLVPMGDEHHDRLAERRRHVDARGP